ncbi:MAG: FHA domain-containing protein [Myxococcaceae bacterium]|nr:FHA domain-containing protein [Myxococcaceae bacterium]
MWVIINPGLSTERVLPLPEGISCIGRTEDNTFWSLHASISRRHAQLEREGERVMLIDLGSKNGTFVNEERIERHELRSGDTFRCGEISFRIEARAREPKPAQTQGLQTRFSSRTMEELLVQEHAPGDLVLKVRQAPPVDSRTAEKLQVLLKVSQLLSSPVPIDELLERIIQLVFQILEVDRAAIFLVEPGSDALLPRVARLSSGEEPSGAFYSQQIIEYVRTHSVAALFADASQDSRLDGASSVVVQSIQASMCVPLKPRNEVLGVLYVDNRTQANRFTGEDLEFLTAFANQAAVSLENARLYETLDNRVNERTRELSEALERLRQTQRQLVAQEKLASLGLLTSGIAHEIKNPLTFINSFAEFSTELAQKLRGKMRQQAGSIPAEALQELDGVLLELQQNMGWIHQQGQRADAIISSMLQHARGTTGQLEQVDVNELAAEALQHAYESFRLRYAGFQAALEVDYQPALAPVLLTPQRVSRVIGNLVENACYALQARLKAQGGSFTPRLRISTREREGMIEIRIWDNGSGIPEAVREQLFTPFFTTRPPGEGTGLGLSLSYDIIANEHGGALEFDGREGDYTEFVVRLPRKQLEVARRMVQEA